jgi:hypothetical protein
MRALAETRATGAIAPPMNGAPQELAMYCDLPRQDMDSRHNCYGLGAINAV